MLIVERERRFEVEKQLLIEINKREEAERKLYELTLVVAKKKTDHKEKKRAKDNLNNPRYNKISACTLRWQHIE